jgi:hypothetical protein
MHSPRAPMVVMVAWRKSGCEHSRDVLDPFHRDFVGKKDMCPEAAFIPV